MNHYHIESINQVSQFFERVAHLSHLDGAPTPKDLQHLIYWLNDATTLLSEEDRFVNVGYGRLASMLSRLSNTHTLYKHTIQNYLHDYPEFEALLLINSRQHFSYFRSREFCNFLNALAHINIFPPQDWMNEWTDATIKCIQDFTELDFLESIHALALINYDPPQEWLEKWLTYSQIHLEMMDPIIAARLLVNLARLGIEPNMNWLNDWLSQFNIILSVIGARDMFELSDIFNMSYFNQNEYYSKKWLKASLEHLESHDHHYTIRTIFSLIYNDIPLCEQWQNKWHQQIENHLHHIHPHDIICYMYACCLMQTPSHHITALTAKVNHLFYNAPALALQEEDLFVFRKLLIVKAYFKLSGCALNITVNDHMALLKRWVTGHRTHSVMQDLVLQFLVSILQHETILHEAFIDCVVDCVDIYVPSHKLIIEVDGMTHYVNGKLNPITQLKMRLLQAAGYNVVRLVVNEIKNGGHRYIMEKLEPFLAFQIHNVEGNSIKQTNTDSQPLPHRK